MTILEEIVKHKRTELAERVQSVGEDRLRAQALARAAPPSLAGALRSAPIGLIAEVKRRSPSAGPLRTPFDSAAVARAYQAAGAQAVSVLMDEAYFGGGEKDFRIVREAVNLPLLYKEFVIDEWQVWHAAALGASAVLLIAAVLDTDLLARLYAAVRAGRMEALVEVHSEGDMEKARAVGAGLVGINNRNLETFEVCLDATRQLCVLAPPSCTLISESGIRSPSDVLALKAAGVHGVLVGETLLRADDPGAAVHTLMGAAWGSL